MSVRRLAHQDVQPESFEFSAENKKWCKQVLKRYPKDKQISAVIPFMMRAQEQEGWVTRAAIEHIADMLGMAYIRALEIATFYTQFQLQPVGTKAHIQVCGTTPCMLRGSDGLIALCKRKINEKQFETNADGTLSWEEVECQGACVNAPMVMIFKDTYEDLTPERLEEIIDAFEAGVGGEIVPGPQIDRVHSAPEGRLMTLTDEDSIATAAKTIARNAEKNSAAKDSAKKAAKSSTAKSVLGFFGGGAAADRADNSDTKPDGKSDSKAGQLSGNAAKEAADNSVEGTVRDSGKDTDKGSAKDAGKKSGKGKAKAKSGKSAEEEKPSLDDKNRPPQQEKPEKIEDDLKMISGVGPVLEGKLHELGIFSFEQIANWKKAECDWVDGYLRFGGRIERDEWIKQAKALAKGGAEEYRKVFGKDPT